ncbi:right-handed parallel beta-helix repeat-containing protein [Roseobacter litoralis]|uniref:Right handed beta helix domain-containing protein n=1 Tax=Roseobacter litoralis (strain ATCC 49566 / DSM 6996 / JCM 21268 / NBRC 15278 / OCh 149) TaxID=391595 RepID=F7ZF43_ROSLO|nr:right-handed parallel beta-helix repeat-containing protein [Roseobacter litoralis]AEI93474.1 hypothetical protein RLO149_c014770 [Roseobacter litoralis Och 149]
MRLLDGHGFASRSLLVTGHGLFGEVRLAARITGLTSNATFGATAQSGASLGFAVSGLPDGVTVTGQSWRTSSAGELATTATYAPDASTNDLENLFVVLTLSDGESIQTPASIIRHPAPVAGTLAPVLEVQGNGTPSVNLAAGFTGADLRYSASPAWITISGSTATIADALRSEVVAITATNSGGSVTVDLAVSIAVRAPVEVQVSPSGNDTTGDGTVLAPFATPQAAQAVMIPGDTLILRPGVYDPFEVLLNGGAASRITVATLPSEVGQAIIRGDLQQHVAYGGPGVAQDNATRDGIRIDGKSYITLRGLTIEYVWRNGVFIKGAGQNTVTGNHIVEDCLVRHTGLSGIMACGERPELAVGANDAFRTRYVTIRNNEVTQTNVVTDYNDTVTNSFGEPGGVGEAITLANSLRYAYVYNNYIHDSRQYGIDFKNHVVDGEITGNRIEDVVRYGIYLDAGETDVRRILVDGNIIQRCRAGIVIAREEDGNDSGDNLIVEDIDLVNNTLANLSRVGIHYQRHPNKDQQDIGYFRRVRARFNTLYNTNTDGSYRDISIDGIATFGVNRAGQQIVSGIELIGNLAWNPDGQMRMATDVAGDPRFTVAQNHNVRNGAFVGDDPLFVDAANGDFNLRAGSPARAKVTTAAYIAGLYAKDSNGTAHVLPTSAGAYYAAA